MRTAVLSVCLGLMFLAASPLLAQTCTTGHPGGNPPELDFNQSGQANKACHGLVYNDHGVCGPINNGGNQYARVRCHTPGSGNSACYAEIWCSGLSGGPTYTCGGQGWSAWAGINSSGKAYTYCEDANNGTIDYGDVCP
jgi:hypothetical protein